MNKRTGLLAATAALLWVTSARATDYFVNADADPSGNGLTWATAYDSLADITPSTTPALAPGDTIFVAGGTNNLYPATVTAYSGVRLIGGFPPTGNPSEGQQNPVLYPTVIDASAATVGL